LHQMSEADLIAVLKSDYAMVGSDGLPLPAEKIHPRQYGTFPRMIRKYVREEKIMSLEQAIRKMTSYPARRFGFKSRGYIRPGDYADIVIFRERQLRDRATFEHPRQYPEGIMYVMVNGRLAAQGHRATGEMPGRFVRIHE